MSRVERLRADRARLIARLAECPPRSRGHAVIQERLERITRDLMQAELKARK